MRRKRQRAGRGFVLSDRRAAFAEVLKRPLYAVGIGELGVSPETLEKRLTICAVDATG